MMIRKADCDPSSSYDWVNKLSSSFNKHVFTCAVSGQRIPDLEAAIIELVGLNWISTKGRKWTPQGVSSMNSVDMFKDLKVRNILHNELGNSEYLDMENELVDVEAMLKEMGVRYSFDLGRFD
ncbi:TrmE-type G domain-containing protein [Forsythia ovata]|uniref:TrmE-type G domain-containing protein n=1 Tax=Forsythia ovata TaxID=205694 RepID=A0ABD1RZM4_9LAMI